ncbi:DUF916 and DUF3324 domain-containing protein [Enterococcus sp. DIV0840c]|uniref:DUF916 and DUF3324 domain-containing protein n=1 Tax=Enterococcus sp. DIV0840c TaxID=2774772 RepID=UPI003D2E3ED6
MKQTLIHVRKKAMSRILILLFALFAFPVQGHGTEGTLNFHVTPELPESQVEGSNSYFDLNLEPGQKETLSLVLQNASSEPIQVDVTPHTAYTNVHGVVEYGKEAPEPDNTLRYSLSDQIESLDSIELAANETKTIDLVLEMPEERFEGFLAGGLRISEVKAEQEVTSSSEEGVAIKNEFAYVVGIVVSNSRDSVQPELELVDVFADQLNNRNVISATLQNTTPTFVNRLSVEASIQRVGENDVLYEASEANMQMAPNSHFHFPISLEGDRFQAGEYVLKLKATSGEEEWSWERAFTIETEEARSLNRADVTIDSSLNWWMIGTIILIMLLLALVVYLIVQKKKANESESEK